MTIKIASVQKLFRKQNKGSHKLTTNTDKKVSRLREKGTKRDHKGEQMFKSEISLERKGFNIDEVCSKIKSKIEFGT